MTEKEAAFDEASYLREEKIYREKLDSAFLTNDFSFFEPPADWALGYSQLKSLLEEGEFPEKRIIKLHVTGPETIWNSFFSNRVSGNLAQSVRETLTLTLTAVGLSQIHRVVSYGRLPLIFIDEPVRSRDLSFFSRMVSSFKKAGALVGVHVCSNPNWEGFESLGLDIFHFDRTAHLRLSGANRNFLLAWVKKGKWVAWGVVPTHGKALSLKEDFAEELLAGVDEIGNPVLSREEILGRSLVASACGTGMLKSESDREIFETLGRTVLALRSHWLGSSRNS